MATVFKPKRSFTAGGVPTLAQIGRGELAINVADRKIYVRNDAGGNTPANDQVVVLANFDSAAATIDDAIVFAIALG